MNNIVAELRSIVMREIELEKEKAELHRRKLAILELDRGPRKTGRAVLSPQNRKALFASLKVQSYEHGKTQ